jgi:hypothetical protein
MARREAFGVLLVFLLANTGSARDDAAHEPRFELRVTPRVSVAFPPVPVIVVAQLVDGEDLEQYYCAGVEWDWGDGSRSVRESDCKPFEVGMPIDRFFSAHHVYREIGEFQVRVRLLRAGATIAAAADTFTLHETALASR